MTDSADNGAQQVLKAPEPINGEDPYELFAQWLADAEASEPADANAMALATADQQGLPNVRMVLLKGAEPNGFVFYTNLESVKGGELEKNPQAAACFHWKSLDRQVRLRGVVEPVSVAEADEYFAGRARTSRIGAWASQQSRPLESRHALEKAVAATAARFGLGTVPRPPYWSGFRIIPSEIEFWRQGMFRLHERIRFERAGAGWTSQRLYP
ncbi:MAG: pyridoxamine 5'-phosphate oxidase [Rhizobiales bacterium]|nr:pyridoxamine 5'-phosphate oxidase [Hyphomicrobiales bacterium]